MMLQKWAVAAKGLAISAVLTLVFFGFAKLLVNPVAGGNAEAYRQEFNLEPPVGEWFIANANNAADSMIVDWTVIFLIYWITLAVFARSHNIVSRPSLAIISLALMLNFYLVLNTIFDWYYWSCFEEPLTHQDFNVRYLLECPTRSTLYDGIIFLPLVLAVIAAIIGIQHSKRSVS